MSGVSDDVLEHPDPTVFDGWDDLNDWSAIQQQVAVFAIWKRSVMKAECEVIARAQMSRHENAVLILNDKLAGSDDWSDLWGFWGRLLTEQELAQIFFAAFKALPADIGVQLIRGITESEFPGYEFEDDAVEMARHWVKGQPPRTLKAFAAEIVKEMAPKDRKALTDWLNGKKRDV